VAASLPNDPPRSYRKMTLAFKANLLITLMSNLFTVPKGIVHLRLTIGFPVTTAGE